MYCWDEQLDYLLGNRMLAFNDDYLEFLVARVWAFTEPVHAVDFGCGFGWLGMKLLPLLPAGAKYTGIDQGERLLSAGRRLFAESPYEAEFITADVNTVELAENGYDVAICKAVLMHLPAAREVLAKMARCVRPGGKVIAIEPHRNGFFANQYVHEFEMPDATSLAHLLKLTALDRMRTGCDPNIGMKLPVYLRELGLRDVECRVSDRVNFYHPGSPEAEMERLYPALVEEMFGDPVDDVDALIANLTERGLSAAEARELAQSIRRTGQEVAGRGKLCHILQGGETIISFGTK